MKILLIGEFSGFYKNLKEGFLELNHEVKIIADGDGWKKIDCDFNLGSSYSGFLGKMIRRFKDIASLKKMKGYDAVLIINPNFFKYRKFGKIMLKTLRKYNKKIYLSAAGDDCQFIKSGIDKLFKYWPYSGMEIEKTDYYQSDKEIEINNLVLETVDGIIPVMYEYAEPYRHSNYKKKLKTTIPLPINCNKIEYKDNIINDKITIFHGLNREEFKGTKYIKEALNKLNITHGDKVDIIIDGKMSLEKYLNVLSKTNIIIDQCKSMSYGMNALIGLAQGKVVLSGGEKEMLLEFGLEENPIINITPDPENIYQELLKLLDEQTLIKKGKDGRKFVEKIHNSKLIAEKYIRIFKEKEGV